MSQYSQKYYFGQSLDEWMEYLPNDISDCGLGLGFIVGTGRRGFKLNDEELLDFVKRGIGRLLDVGGIPLKYGPESWVPETKYGTDRESIITGVINDWLASGAKDPEWGEYWFGLPEICKRKYGEC